MCIRMGSTSGGNPLACALARTALRILVEEKLVECSAELRAYFLEKLQILRSPVIREIRGRGLWIAPPLVSTHEEIDWAFHRLAKVLV